MEQEKGQEQIQVQHITSKYKYLQYPKKVKFKY